MWHIGQLMTVYKLVKLIHNFTLPTPCHSQSLQEPWLCSWRGQLLLALSVLGMMMHRLSVMTSSPGDGKALKGQQTWAQPLGWPLSHQGCWVVSEMVQGYHS